MKIIGITICTNPDYRQDPTRECIRQMLEICDEVVVVCGGGQPDLNMVNELEEGDNQKYKGRIHYRPFFWPQPKWRLDELPKHLNAGLVMAREYGADWIIKFDADYFIHENDAKKLRAALEAEWHNDRILAMELEKVQVTIPTHGRLKGGIPVAIKAKSPIVYGQIAGHYSDLCQPIIWDGQSKTSIDSDDENGIPLGDSVPRDMIKRTGVWLWNYGYTFKTYERAYELLYWFDIAHALWWGWGWYKTPLSEITPESAMAHHIKMSAGRVAQNKKKFPVNEHPKHIQDAIRNLKPDQFGHSLWGKITMPE